MRNLYFLAMLFFPSICFSQLSLNSNSVKVFDQSNLLAISGSKNIFSGPNQNLNIEVSSDKKNVTYKFPLPIGTVNNAIRSSLEVKSVFDKSDGRGDSFDLDGLKDATTVTLGFDIALIDFEETADDIPFKRRLCSKYYFDSTETSCSFGTIQEDAKKRFESLPSSNNTGRQALCERAGIDTNDIEQECNATTFSEAHATNYRLEDRDYFGVNTSAFLFPIKFTYGYERVSFIDRTAFKKEKDPTEPFSASVGFAYLTNSYLIGAGFEWQKKFDKDNEGAICNLPEMAGDQLSCLTGLIEPPDREIGRNSFIEVRTRRFNSDVGVGVKVTYDSSDNETGIEVPIYFIGSNPLELNGGIKLGWTSEEKELGASFFIGTSFAFF